MQLFQCGVFGIGLREGGYVLEECGFGRFVGGRESAEVGLEGGVSPLFGEGVWEDAEGVRILGFC